MKNAIYSLLFAVLVGAAAAFFRPAAPYQVEVEASHPAVFPRGGASDAVVLDAGLDNPEIAEDRNIEPSRKCGFCMGVSRNDLGFVLVILHD